MRILFLIPLILFFLSVRGVCEETSESPSIIDFSSLRNPFVSQLPAKPQIIKTPVEPVVEKPDNVSNPVVTPQVMIEQPQMMQEDDVEAGMPSLKLQGILWGSDRPQAIINESVVGEGDSVMGVFIKKISKEGVDIQFQDKTIRILVEQ